MTRVLLYSDEPILAKGLESVLRPITGFALLPTSDTLASLMDQITNGAPDLVLMDLTAEITFAVLSDMKHAMNRSRIVLWVNTISTELAFQAMGLGVLVEIFNRHAARALHQRAESVFAPVPQVPDERALLKNFPMLFREAIAQPVFECRAGIVHLRE